MQIGPKKYQVLHAANYLSAKTKKAPDNVRSLDDFNVN